MYILLFSIAIILFFYPTWIVYQKCLKFDDYTGSFLHVLFHMPHYLKRYKRIQMVTFNKRFVPCNLWYVFSLFSLILMIISLIWGYNSLMS